jgi:putative phosphoribosyl transferase
MKTQFLNRTEAGQFLAENLRRYAAVIVPEEFYGVGQWYEDFSQTTDDEVKNLLVRVNHRPSPAAA